VLPVNKFNDFVYDDVLNEAKEEGGMVESFMTVIDMITLPPVGDTIVVNNIFVSRLVSTCLSTFPYKCSIVVTLPLFQDIDVINANVITEDGEQIPKRNSHITNDFVNPAFLNAIGFSADAISEITDLSIRYRRHRHKAQLYGWLVSATKFCTNITFIFRIIKKK